MTALRPEGILIDGKTGALGEETGRFAKRLADLKGLFVLLTRCHHLHLKRAAAFQPFL